MKELLTLASINKIPNGEDAVTEFDRLIRVCAEDCRNRPDVAKHRKVLLQLDLYVDEHDIMVDVSTKHVLPPKSAGLARGSLDRSGKLFVNPVSTDDPDQKGLDEA